MTILKKYPIYRKFILNNFISTLGDSMYYIALLAYAAQFANPGIAILMVTLSETLPGIFHIITGSLADMSLSKTQKTMISGLVRGILYFIVGILIGYGQSLMILAGIVVINFISDLLGKYSGGLMTPFVLYIVKGEDIEEAQGLSGAVTQTVAILAQFVGAFLMGIFSYQILAWINSLAFFLSTVVIYSISKVLINIEKEKMPTPQTTTPQTNSGISLANIWQQIKLSMKEIRKKPAVYQPIMMFAVVNGGLEALLPLLSLLLAQNNGLLVKSFAFTVALFRVVLSVGLIIGNLIGPKVFKKTSLNTLCQSIFVGLILTGVALLSRQVPIITFVMFLLGGLVGSATTKLNALVVMSFEVDKLATISGGINTMLSIAPPIAATIFSTIAAINLKAALILFIVFCASMLLGNWIMLIRNEATSSVDH